MELSDDDVIEFVDLWEAEFGELRCPPKPDPSIMSVLERRTDAQEQIL